MFLYLSISSWQFGLFSPSEINFTPESCRSLLLRSSSLRIQFEDCRADDKLSQPLSSEITESKMKESRNTHITIHNLQTYTQSVYLQTHSQIIYRHTVRSTTTHTDRQTDRQTDRSIIYRHRQTDHLHTTQTDRSSTDRSSTDKQIQIIYSHTSQIIYRHTQSDNYRHTVRSSTDTTDRSSTDNAVR